MREMSLSNRTWSNRKMSREAGNYFVYGTIDQNISVVFNNGKCNEPESRFDKKLKETWTNAMDAGHFRYVLNINQSKVLPGKYSFFAQLNVDRATKRRTPQDITSMSQPFDPSKFNFTNVNKNEIMFKLARESTALSECSDHLVINVSPLEFGHSLLLPQLNDCLPQMVTIESICLALEVLLLSASPYFRVGFNSLCGYASVNHLHFHVYYLKQNMLLEHIDVKHLAGPCYELVDYPAAGFVFQLNNSLDVKKLAAQVHKLTNLLRTLNVAYNIYITRGMKLINASTNDSMVYNAVRVYVWARANSSGAKESAGFNPALCELFGHLNVKDSDLYDKLDEQEVSAILSEVCEETFYRVRGLVKELFKKNHCSC